MAESKAGFPAARVGIPSDPGALPRPRRGRRAGRRLTEARAGADAHVSVGDERVARDVRDRGADGRGEVGQIDADEVDAVAGVGVVGAVDAPADVRLLERLDACGGVDRVDVTLPVTLPPPL